MIKHTVTQILIEHFCPLYASQKLDEVALEITQAVRKELDEAMKLVLDARFEGIPG